MQMITRERLIRQLTERGLKITPQRLAILDALIENGRLHPGAYLIYEQARKKAKHLSLSTVYATLADFSRQGLIKSLEFDRVENRYDVNLKEHVNLVCRQCGKIEDYSIPPSVEPKDVARKSGFMVTDARMEYYGYCRDCLAHRPDLPGAQKGQDRAS